MDLSFGSEKAVKLKMNRFAEVSAKTKENLMETFKEFYMEIYYRNKKKFVQKRNKNLRAYENLQKKEVSNCCWNKNEYLFLIIVLWHTVI